MPPVIAKKMNTVLTGSSKHCNKERVKSRLIVCSEFLATWPIIPSSLDKTNNSLN